MDNGVQIDYGAILKRLYNEATIKVAMASAQPEDRAVMAQWFKIFSKHGIDAMTAVQIMGDISKIKKKEDDIE